MGRVFVLPEDLPKLDSNEPSSYNHQKNGHPGIGNRFLRLASPPCELTGYDHPRFHCVAVWQSSSGYMHE